MGKEIKRFTNRDPLESEFTWKPRKLTEVELEDLDLKFAPIRALPVSGREKGMLMLVKLGAAVQRYSDIAVKPEKMAEAEDKIEQWEAWRARKFPAPPRIPFSEWKRRQPAPVTHVEHHDDERVDLFKAAMEVNPGDLSF